MAAQLLEPVIGLGKGDELAGADRGEVGRVGEEDQSAPAIVIQAPLAVGRAGVKRRRRLIEERQPRCAALSTGRLSLTIRFRHRLRLLTSMTSPLTSASRI
jgi:hypothetical protein